MKDKLTRREFFQMWPSFGQIVSQRQQEARRQEEPVSPEVIELINIASTHSMLRDQALLSLINNMILGKQYELGHYGTLFEVPKE